MTRDDRELSLSTGIGSGGAGEQLASDFEGARGRVGPVGWALR